MTHWRLAPIEPKPYEWADRVCLMVAIDPDHSLLEQVPFLRPRIEWSPGPWEDEPDFIAWRHPENGLRLLMRRNMMGAWCGYAGLTPEHPLHGLDWHEAADLARVQTHWGLTFAGAIAESDESDIWWLGFDCAHAFDVMPAVDACFNTPQLRQAMGSRWRSSRLMPGDRYRTVEVVRALCEALGASAFQVGLIRFPVADGERSPP